MNTQTNNNNCGTCGTVCAGGTACTGGRCVCPMGQTSCGTPAACVNTQTDRANCGACGRACTVTGQTCTNGMCACPTGTSVCGSGAAAACVNLMTSATNCGMCGRACPMGQSCMGGMCRGTPPANDTRAGATLINLASPSQTLMADTTFARNDVTGSCRCTSGNDVWFRFVLTAPEVVYADTLGSTPDTALFLTDSNGTALSNAGTNVVCNDDASMAGLCAGISGLQSQIVARLAAGTYYLVLSGCSAGASSIRFQHLPAGNGTSTRITPSAMSQTVTGTTSGTGTVANSCCSAGPENSAFWITCPGTAATTFQATSCSASTGANAANFDNAISVYSALRTGGAFNVCNDDVGSGFVCNAGSSVGATIPATAANQAGLNVMILDSCIGVGNYSVRYVLANCTSGTRCGTACVDTNFDENNCGGCDRRCPSGNVCSGGVCYAPPSNDTRASATPISLAASQVVLSANNAAATANQANTGGACTCTNGRDVFYSFTLTRREVVYADTIGSARDTSLFFLNAAGTYISTPVGPNARTCNDDGGLTGCATGTQSQVMTVLDAGTYYLVLSGCGEGGPATIRFQHLPVGNGPVAALGASVMGGSIVNGTTAGTGTISGACCSSGPENTYLWYTCQGAMAGAFTASTCGRATWDTSLSQRSAARTTPGVEVCQDDAGGTCGTRSNISSTIPAGPGIHALYVDGCLNQSGMYSVLYTRP